MSGVKRYRVLFLGLSDHLECFKEHMSELGVTPEMSERIVLKAPVVLKAGMTRDHAHRYAVAVQKAGARVNMQEEPVAPPPIKPLEYFTMCTECGHKQPRREYCVRCGHALSDSAGRNGRPHRSL